MRQSERYKTTPRNTAPVPRCRPWSKLSNRTSPIKIDPGVVEMTFPSALTRAYRMRPFLLGGD